MIAKLRAFVRSLRARVRRAVSSFRAPAFQPLPREPEIGTVGVDFDVDRDVTVDLNIPAAIEFRPRNFIYTGTPRAFVIVRVFVANGANSNFAHGHPADLYDGHTLRAKWPTFYNSPPLTITVRNVSGGAARFAGVLHGEHWWS